MAGLRGSTRPAEAQEASDALKGRRAVAEALVARYSVRSERLTDEDILLVREGLRVCPDGPVWSLYCICDGHAGAAAAKFVKRYLWRALCPRLPTVRLPDAGCEAYHKFATEVRSAMVNAFVKLDEDFVAKFASSDSGAAVTTALLCESLLTVANVGDADAVLDTGADALLATVNHRIESNDVERERLLDGGALLAPMARSLTGPCESKDHSVGPVRCWPGGMAVARSVGDVKGGKNVIPCPHVFQITLPQCGGRLLMGSSGLWDLIHWKEATHSTRATPTKEAASRVVTLALLENNWSLHQDASALVVDILPPAGGDFPRLVRASARQRRRRNRPTSWCGLQLILEGIVHRLCRPDDIPSGGGFKVVANIDGRVMLRVEREASISDSCSSHWVARTGRKAGWKSSTGEQRRSAGYSERGSERSYTERGSVETTTSSSRTNRRTEDSRSSSTSTSEEEAGGRERRAGCYGCGWSGKRGGTEGDRLHSGDAGRLLAGSEAAALKRVSASSVSFESQLLPLGEGGPEEGLREKGSSFGEQSSTSRDVWRSAFSNQVSRRGIRPMEIVPGGRGSTD